MHILSESAPSKGYSLGTTLEFTMGSGIVLALPGFAVNFSSVSYD